ncbi:hypothetical protein LNJ08_12580 [Tenacibaculum finnmarkense genomovar ulcerans]|uniref:M43 family zinc metalloprotease n=1 Tax=Tenacibaculum finnmarkense TaxID=2781243 RepID=UPI001E5A634A|nr:M43 family zinc metalloprotease [Tenacibaculum finnmarkense]MCD8455227.1 hypothetical protein [Tenacibaculum finnmarkense genomovar ulcerans]
MKKSLYGIIIMLLLTQNLYSQKLECNLKLINNNVINISKANIVNRKNSSNEILYFRIQHHIIRKSNGTGGISQDNIDTAMEDLNKDFLNSKIRFYSCSSVNYINSDTYYDFLVSDENTIRNTYNVSDAINIYHFNSIKDDDDSFCGYAYYPSSNRNFVAMDNSCLNNGSTFTHELGHFFGLPDTHVDRPKPNQELEYVNGSNCSSIADKFCDTPADPQLSTLNVNSSCNYTDSTSTDQNGDVYTPDTRNFMSYSRKSCRSRFSNEQQNKIRDYANSNPRNNLQGSKSNLENINITNNYNKSADVISLKNIIISNSNTVFDYCESFKIDGSFKISIGSTLKIN